MVNVRAINDENTEWIITKEEKGKGYMSLEIYETPREAQTALIQNLVKWAIVFDKSIWKNNLTKKINVMALKDYQSEKEKFIKYVGNNEEELFAEYFENGWVMINPKDIFVT